MIICIVTTHEAATKNPLVLAFVGDAYWTLFVRRLLAERSREKVNKLHLEANKYVCATAQSGFFNKIAPFLTETEADIAGRARNAEVNTRPKHCKLSEYRLSTAFEAIVGYNLLAGNEKRLHNLFEIVLEGGLC